MVLKVQTIAMIGPAEHGDPSPCLESSFARQNLGVSVPTLSLAPSSLVARSAMENYFENVGLSWVEGKIKKFLIED
jgi:hypothetical protein